MYKREACLLLLVVLVCSWVNELRAEVSYRVPINETVSLGGRTLLLSVAYRTQICRQIEAAFTQSIHQPNLAQFGIGEDFSYYDSYQERPIFLTSADPCYLFMSILR